MLGSGLSPLGSTTHLNPSNTPTERCRSAALLPPDAVVNLENSQSIVPRRLSLQRVKMASARIKNAFHAPHGHGLFRSNSSNLVPQAPIDEAQKQKEKDFLSCYECNGTPLSPSQIAEAPRAKELGIASKQLRISDFELIKTIGTGTYPQVVPVLGSCAAADPFNSGTFARVWLACLQDPKEGQEKKYFALKILRKVDSMCTKSISMAMELMRSLQ